MKNIDELIDHNSCKWQTLLESKESAKNRIEILPASETSRQECLLSLQISTSSFLGSFVYESGGLLVDNGWLRVLGSGHTSLTRTVAKWTELATKQAIDSWPYILIADDVIGGFFAIDCGSLGERGSVFYFAPDTFKWECLGLDFASFVLEFCMNQDLNDFYHPYRWKEWNSDIKSLSGDQAFSIMPPLFIKRAGIFQRKDIWFSRTRKPVPIEELFSFSMNTAKELEKVPSGGTIKFSWSDFK